MPRLFIAMPIGRDVVERLTELSASAPSGWRWARPDSLHLTLAFLGGVDERNVVAAERAMRRSSDGAIALDLAASGIGAFPDERRARVLWAGVGGDVEPLIGLQTELATSLRTEGFELEDRPFRPHITLARSRDPRPIPGRLDGSASFGSWRASELHLMESHLSTAGPRYELRALAALGG